MDKKTTKRRIAVGAAALAVLLAAATLLIVLSLGTGSAPKLYFKLLNLRLMDDGSIQAAVTVSAEDMPYLTSAQFSLAYNEKYLQPSDASDNTVLERTDGAAVATRAFFREDEGLYVVNGAPLSPFMNSNGQLKLGMVGRSGTDRLLSLALYLDEGVLRSNLNLNGGSYKTPTGRIKWRTFFEDDGDLDQPTYGQASENKPHIDAAGKEKDGGGAVLGTLSFRVNPDGLTEMVRRFGVGGDNTGFAGEEKQYLLGLAGILQGNDTWAATEHVYDEGSGELKPVQYTETIPNGMEVKFLFQFPKVLVKAAPAVTDITVSAYEAYTNGTISDLAATLRKHSPAIRAGYADGSLEDFLLPWGADDTQHKYEYKVYQVNGDGTKTLLSDASPYDPTHGTYRVEQYFFYEEADETGGTVTKRYPLPMAVNLTVIPVELEEISGANQYRAYINTPEHAGSVPSLFSKLGLPNEAVLAVSPAPGTASLTVPLTADRWLNYSPDLSNTVGKAPGGSAVNWPVDDDGEITPDAGAGTYDFAYGLTRVEIQSAYPWVTVKNDNYILPAQRVIVTDDEGWIDPANYGITAIRSVADSSNAVFTVKKTDGTDSKAFAEGTALALSLPNGQRVEGGYTVTLNGGEAAVLTDAGETDTALRRYLNLGGWFVVSVEEPGAALPTYLPVYLASRENLYLESRAGDGEHGRFDFTGYNAGLFPYDGERPLGKTVVLPTGYDVKTTYDGMTGAPLGRLGTIRSGWTATRTEQSGALWDTYGPAAYSDGWFDGYGAVKNGAGENVELRVQDWTEKEDALRLTLTCAPGTAGVTEDGGGEVSGVVYNTRQKGYRTRQEFALTLANEGTRDIYGLTLNLPDNNHFEIIKAPAAYLAAGTSTTFVITYMYNLSPEDAAAIGETFRDAIYITTNETGTSHVKDFTAQFRVTSGPVSTVTVVTNSPRYGNPNDTATYGLPIMGDAELIVGLGAGEPADGAESGTAKPDRAAGPVGYEDKYKYVWVRSETYDEYEVDAVYYYVDNVVKEANRIDLTAYRYTGPDGEGDTVSYWFFLMGATDLTVHVDFKEPVSSKLRLSAIIPAAANAAGGPLESRPLYRWDNNALTAHNGDPLTVEESGLDHFFVVLRADDEKAQLTLRLREVLAILTDGRVTNGDIDVNVYVTAVGGTNNPILNRDGNTGIPAGPPPDYFITSEFAAPEPGGTLDVEIVVSERPADTAAIPETRKVTVTLARPSGEVAHTLRPGNSPYGMIENSSMTSAEKMLAKEAFNKERAFTVGHIPAKGGSLTHIYSPNAWAGTDYDKSDTALFVYGGEKFLEPGVSDVKDSIGRAVSPEDIDRTVTVTLLDGAAATQVGRFSGTGTVTLHLGAASGPGAEVDAWWLDGSGNPYLIRPGVYAIRYAFRDYDGTELSFTRPLVILARNGDANASFGLSGAADETVADARTIENRATDPLGYTVTAAAYPDRQLFQYRVCDVNNDGRVNNIDANLAQDINGIVPFYLPVDYREP